MNWTRFITILLCLSPGLIFVSPSFAQEEIMILKSEGLAPHKRSLVRFNHEKHSETYECVRCHHEYDDLLNNTGGQGNTCSDCHELEPNDNPIPLVEAFHKQCKSCHSVLAKRLKNEKIPLVCGECHLKKN